MYVLSIVFDKTVPTFRGWGAFRVEQCMAIGIGTWPFPPVEAVDTARGKRLYMQSPRPFAAGRFCSPTKILKEFLRARRGS